MALASVASNVVVWVGLRGVAGHPERPLHLCVRLSRAIEARILIGKLTPRERELLQALAEGLPGQGIAQWPYVGGVGTVRSHMTHLLAKFGVDSRLQALVFAIRYGPVEVD